MSSPLSFTASCNPFLIPYCLFAPCETSVARLGPLVADLVPLRLGASTVRLGVPRGSPNKRVTNWNASCPSLLGRKVIQGSWKHQGSEANKKRTLSHCGPIFRPVLPSVHLLPLRPIPTQHLTPGKDFVYSLPKAGSQRSRRIECLGGGGKPNVEDCACHASWASKSILASKIEIRNGRLRCPLRNFDNRCWGDQDHHSHTEL